MRFQCLPTLKIDLLSLTKLVILAQIASISSMYFSIQRSQQNTSTCEQNEHGEPWLHRIKWYRVDQCAQALTSKVLNCPPLG